MRFRSILLITFALVAAATASSRSASRYARVMSTEAGRDTLRNLALWEDQRVTGDGRLFDYLTSRNPLVRLRAVEVIGRIQDPADAQRLLPMLEDRDERVVDEAFFALGQIASPVAVTALVKMCASGSVDHKVLAAQALGKIGGDEAVETLVNLLHDFNARTRAAAAMGLARAADENAIPSLLIAAEDPDPDVAWRAIYALEKVDSKKVGDRIIKFLEPGRDTVVRAYTARTLGKQKYGGAVNALCDALGEDDLGLVVNACNALGEIGKKKSVDPLGEVLASHPSHHARTAAATALGKIGEKRGKEYLIQALMDRSTEVRVASIYALTAVLGDNAEMFIDQAMDDSSPLVRAAAVECIGEAEIEDRAGELMTIARKDDDVRMREAAVRALGHLDVDTVPPFLVEMLADPDWVVATEAAAAIGAREYEDGVPALIDTYRARETRHDVDLHLQILETLRTLEVAQGPAVELLRACVDDPDKRVRTLAADILNERGLPVPPMKSDRAFYTENFDRSRLAALAPPVGIVHAVITTPHGDIDIDLYGDDAIQTVDNFIKLARKNFYDGLTFHRVVPNFVAQGGCPRGDGWGDDGYFIRSEFNHYTFGEGVIGIAHAGKDTGGTQFFITHSPQPHLDGRYTVFGRVRRGMDVVMKIDQGDEMTVKIVE